MKQRSAVSRSFLRCQPLHSHRRENEILSGKGPAKIFRPRPPRRGGVSPSSRALASSPSASVGRFSPRPLSVSSRSRSEPRGRTDGRPPRHRRATVCYLRPPRSGRHGRKPLPFKFKSELCALGGSASGASRTSFPWAIGSMAVTAFKTSSASALSGLGRATYLLLM